MKASNVMTSTTQTIASMLGVLAMKTRGWAAVLVLTLGVAVGCGSDDSEGTGGGGGSGGSGGSGGTGGGAGTGGGGVSGSGGASDAGDAAADGSGDAADGCAPTGGDPFLGTWVQKGAQAFVFESGNTMKVMDPTLTNDWCSGSYTAQGDISGTCVATSPGGAHPYSGKCSITGATMTCQYSAVSPPGPLDKTFVGERTCP